MMENDKTAKRIISVVCNYFDVPQEQVIGTSRKREYVVARQMAMILMRENTTLSTTDIGSYFAGEGKGSKDHSTVIYACTTIRDSMEWVYGPKTIAEHLETLRTLVKQKTAMQYPIQITRYSTQAY